MIYDIHRTSDWFKESKPCERAELQGEDELGYDKYTIEINTLEDLQELIKEVGKIIIDESTIEIYDYYREQTMRYTTDIAHCKGSGCNLKDTCQRYWLHQESQKMPLYARSQCIPYTIGEYNKETNKCKTYKNIEQYDKAKDIRQLSIWQESNAK